jgi:hypothetical protein
VAHVDSPDERRPNSGRLKERTTTGARGVCACNIQHAASCMRILHVACEKTSSARNAARWGEPPLGLVRGAGGRQPPRPLGASRDRLAGARRPAAAPAPLGRGSGGATPRTRPGVATRRQDRQRGFAGGWGAKPRAPCKARLPTLGCDDRSRRERSERGCSRKAAGRRPHGRCDEGARRCPPGWGAVPCTARPRGRQAARWSRLADAKATAVADSGRPALKTLGSRSSRPAGQRPPARSATDGAGAKGPEGLHAGSGTPYRTCSRTSEWRGVCDRAG